jgi:predicted PurR-regulated permease PerM
MDRALSSGPIVWFGIIVTTLLLLVIFQTVLWLVVPILLAIVSYYVLSPMVNMAMSHGLTRARSVLIVTAMLCVFLVALGGIAYPKISAASHDWRGYVNEAVTSGTDLALKAEHTLMAYSPFPHAAPPPAPRSVGIVGLNARPAPAPETEQDAFKASVSDFVSRSSSDVAFELARWIPSLFLVPVITYFFLLDGPRFKRFLVQAIPNAYFEKGLYLLYRVEDQIRRYFQGVLTLTIIDGTCLGVGMWLLGLPGPFFLASIAAVLAWLPYLGSITGCLMVVLVAAHQASVFAVVHHTTVSSALPYEAVALFLGVRLLDDFVFLPLTIGRSLHLHPLIAILMILLGGAVAGIAGLLLVMPVLGVVMVAGQIIGELASDPRISARHHHARQLRRSRAQLDL